MSTPSSATTQQASEAQTPPPSNAMREAERRVFAKIGWGLMPGPILAYNFNYLTRKNVGVSAWAMNQAIGLTATQLGFGAGVFFLAYCLLEVPSNIIL